MGSEQSEQKAERADFLEQIVLVLGGRCEKAVLNKGEMEVVLSPETLLDSMNSLASVPSLLFAVLIDVTAVDYLNRLPRFDVVYHLLSMKYNQRLRVKVPTSGEKPVSSVTSIWSAAGWFEREAWDMYGILFSEHSDLRRILSDYGFDGHPLRKDFPLSGYVETRYDNEQQRVVYEPVKLQQEYRSFDYESPWEGIQNGPSFRDENSDDSR